MGNVLVINATAFENRVAAVEDGTIAEYYVERKREKGIVGNIYKGRVVRVLPGMQAAFVDLGTDKAGFLYVNDVSYDPSFSDEAFDLSEGEWGGEDLPDDAADEIEAVYGQGPEAFQPAECAEAAGPSIDGEEGGSAEEGEPVTAAEAAEPSEAAEGEEAAEPSESAESQAAQAAEPSEAAESQAAQAAEPSEAAESSEAVDSSQAAEVRESNESAEPGDAAEPLEARGTDEAPTAETEDEAAREEDESEDDEDDEDEDEDVEDDDDVDDDEDEDEDEDEPEEGEEPGAEASAGDSEGEASASDAEGGRAPDDRGRRGRRRTKRRGATHQRTTERVPEARKERTRRPVKRSEIQDLLKEGDEIVVQVAKAPIGSKGARITTHVSLPGRHLVFMPTVDHVGISRRIASDKERRRLRQIIEEIRPPGTGFIVRTVADGVDRDKLVADARFLLNLWADMNKRKERVSAPALLHPDLDLILRATRDLFGEEVERLIIDDEKEYQRLLAFMEVHMPALKDKVEHYKGREPIFDAYGIEDEMRRAQQRRVWLKSGGYLIIDQAEALTAIDVNSGRYIGKKNLEETIVKINIEAAEEVVYQLRLRNMGGIIILDFIDMEKAGNREKVYRALEEALRKDKAKTNILKISELGLVEMTRKRVRESLTRMMNEPCPYCDGRGMMKTDITVAYEVLRDTMREAAHRREDTIFVNCSPEVAALLTTVERDALRYTMERAGKKLVMKAQEGYHREQYDLYARNTETGTSVVLGQGGGKDKIKEKGQSRSKPATAAPAEQAKREASAPPAPANGESRSDSGGTGGASSRRRRRRRGRGRRDGGRGESKPGEQGGGESSDGGGLGASAPQGASPGPSGGSEE